MHPVDNTLRFARARRPPQGPDSFNTTLAREHLSVGALSDAHRPAPHTTAPHRAAHCCSTPAPRHAPSPMITTDRGRPWPGGYHETRAGTIQGPCLGRHGPCIPCDLGPGMHEGSGLKRVRGEVLGKGQRRGEECSVMGARGEGPAEGVGRGQGRGEGGRAAKGVPARADRTAHDAAGIAAGVHERVACTNGPRASRAAAGLHQPGEGGEGASGAARTDRPTKRLPKREVASAPEAPVPARACTGRRRRCLAERSAAPIQRLAPA